MIREKSCGAVVSKPSGDTTLILLIKHKNGGHWAFPKGHVENNETEEETALREILEETGLAVELNSKFRVAVSYSPKIDTVKDVIYFAAVSNVGEAVAQPEEVEKICWVEADKAIKRISFESDRKVLKKYLEFIKFKEKL